MVKLAAQKLHGDLSQDPLARKWCQKRKRGCDIGYWLDLSSKFLAQQQSGFSEKDCFSPALRCGKVMETVRRQLGLSDCNPRLVTYLDLRRERSAEPVVSEKSKVAAEPLFTREQLEAEMVRFVSNSNFVGYENFVRNEIAKILVSLGKVNKEVQIKCSHGKKWDVQLIVGCNPYSGRGANKFVALNQAFMNFINKKN